MILSPAAAASPASAPDESPSVPVQTPAPGSAAPAARDTGRSFTLRPAIRERTSLLIGLVGPSGSGKTYSALRLASGLREATGGDIIVIDTENGRAKHYADVFDFKHVDVAPPFGSQDYQSALAFVARQKPAVIILDTLSHEHDGEGGMLDFYAAELERLGGNDPALHQKHHLAAWRKPKAARRALLAALLRLDAHVIICLRASERTRLPKDASAGDLIDMGFTPIAGPEFIYELTCCALLRPGAGGAPTWASSLPGEHAAIKLPRQFQKLLPTAEPFAERHGQALARWAQGCDAPCLPSSQPSHPPPPARTRRRKIDAHPRRARGSIAAAPRQTTRKTSA